MLTIRPHGLGRRLMLATIAIFCAGVLLYLVSLIIGYGVLLQQQPQSPFSIGLRETIPPGMVGRFILDVQSHFYAWLVQLLHAVRAGSRRLLAAAVAWFRLWIVPRGRARTWKSGHWCLPAGRPDNRRHRCYTFHRRGDRAGPCCDRNCWHPGGRSAYARAANQQVVSWPGGDNLRVDGTVWAVAHVVQDGEVERAATWLRRKSSLPAMQSLSSAESKGKL